MLVGSPGLGKSRLIEELGRRLGDNANVIDAHCDPAGGATFSPLADALREFLDIDAGVAGDALSSAIESRLPDDESDRTRIANGIASLLAGAPASPEETFFVVRRLLASFAANKPLLLVIDDVQWAEPLFLDLVEHLVQWGDGVPLVLLAGGRPELRDLRSSFVTVGGLVADVITLDGLDAGAATRLAAHVIGASDLPAAVAAKVLATSEGNPLFVGELVRMLVHEGILTRADDRWIVSEGLASFEMPPTIHALLAARIERLQPEDRTILERAAVIGRQFSRGAVAELLPHGAAGLDARLEALGRAELIDRDAGWFLGEPVLRFHHVLIRDAAYRRLLKETRAELHARFADWIERRAADSFEHDETIGWHLEQAHQLLAELGPLDESGHTLGGRAAQRLSAAGRRALARDDVSLAANLLQRALGCLHGADPGRADLALDGCEALLAAGEVGRAVAVIDELDRLAASSDRLRAWHTCFVGQLTALTAPEELHSTADAVAGAAARLARLGDTAGEAKAQFVHAQALARLGKVGACEAALDRALAAARSAGDRRRANAVLAGAPLAALWGPSPVTRASGRCLDVVRVLRITQGAPAVESVALSCQGVLEALRGRTDAARRMIASSRKMVEELGITHRLFEADVFAARIDLLEGDTVAAERGLRGAYEGLRDLGLGIDAARAAALLARTVLAEGRVAEAETLSHDSEALAGDDLQAAIAWRGVRAEALAQRGEIDGAIDLARAAVQIAASTDALLDHADARLALAAALRAAGRSGEANLEEQRALDLWETKGATLLAERARGDAASADVRPTTSAPSLAAPGATAATGATGVAGAPAATRAVRPNSATVLCERLVAAINARDAAAFDALLSDDHVLVHHTTGVTSGKRENIARWTAAFRAGQLPCRGEIVAALGFDLALVRASTVVSGLEGGDFAAFGPTEFQEVLIAETDGSDGISRVEVFAADRLGEAVARFYQRYAERLPEGQARDHAVTTAHAVLGMFTVSPEYQVDDVMMPDVEIVDHRLVGYGTLLTRQKASAWSAATEELAQDRTIRIDEVLGLSADALLRRTTVSGKLRASGGAFESSFYSLSAFGQDGRITRQELFDVDDRAGALARFDDVATQTVEPPSKLRRLRPNAASAKMAALEAAFRARDLDAVDALCGESLETVDHPAGATYGREGQLESARRMMRLADLEFRLEVLATLTDSMCLCRRRISATGTSGGSFDVAEYEMEHIVLAEIDEVGRSRRYEIFAPDHLSVAVGRFYERYAELLPGGLDRDRAEVTARAMSAYVDASDVDRWAPLVAPDVASVDHRVLGTWSARSWKELRAHFDSLFALASGVEFRVDDVLALSPEALLVRTMNSGITLASGGAYERPFLLLAVCGSDGLVKNSEYFDLGCEAEALARFDELVGGGDEAGASGARSSRFDNTAVELQERTVACFGARDWARLTELLDPNFRCSDRRHMARLDIDRDDFIGMSRALGDMDTVSLESDIVATRGDRLLLYRARIEVADGDVGPSDLEHLNIAETNERGDRFVAVVRFDADDLEAAYAELEARYAAGEGAEYPVALAYLVEFQRAFKSRDWDAMARLGSSDQVAQNHRLVGWGSIEGSDVWVRPLQELVALAPDVRMRANHLRLSELGTLVQLTWSGTQDGGAFETPIVIVTELGEDGRHRRMDVWDADAVDTAFARFGEINSPTRSRGLPFANSAFEVMRESIAAWSRRDERGFWEPHASTFRYRDHRRQFQLDLDHEEFVEFTRPILAMAVSASLPLIATRGEHLVLVRLCAEVAEEPVGPSEIDSLFVVETNERREIVGYDRYDLDDLDAAYAQLDALWEAGEAAVHRQASSWVAATRRTFECRDWGAMAQTGADDQVATNHRFVGWGTLQGAAAWVPPLQELVTLAPDVRMRSDHVRTSLRAALWKYSWYGTREGGAFEIPCVLVAELNEDGRHRRFDVWDGDALDAAFARFEELSASVIPSSSLRFENAATRTLDRASEAMRANDWARCVALLAPEFRCLGRRKMLRFDADRDEFLAGIRPWFDMNQSQVEAQVVATRGGRCALVRWSSRGESGDVGPSEIELLVVVEVNENGDATRMVTFGCDQVEAGYAELDARYSEGGGR
ncbi:MAG: DUF4440 domain-containing protein [Myxococcales bacterium]|nr:MAG: DUF4440 domain-containing protein [Myxococcales bacterium]